MTLDELDELDELLAYNSERNDDRLEIYTDNLSEELWEMCFDAELESNVNSVLKLALEKHIKAVEKRLEPYKRLYKLLQQDKS